MNNKEKFMLYVYLGAIARDLSRETHTSQAIVQVASRVPEYRIPVNALNAAQVFLQTMDGGTRPFAWMQPRSS